MDVDDGQKQRPKKKRTARDIADKMKVIEAVSKGEKPSDVARQFGLNPSTVAGILAKQNKYREAWQKGATDVKAIKVPKFAKLDEALFEWFKIQRAQNVPISGVMLLEKARKFGEQMGIDNFKGSNGFLEKFKERHAIQFRAVSGESSAVDPNVAANWIENVLPKLIDGYDERDVFNADETA